MARRRAGEDDVRLARQVGAVEAVAAAQRPEQPPHGELGPRRPSSSPGASPPSVSPAGRRPSKTVEQGGGEVALGEAGHDHHDLLAGHGPSRAPGGTRPRARRPRRCPRAGPPRAPRGGRRRRLSSLETRTTSSITPRSRIAGDEARADALDLVRPRRAAGEHGRGLRLHRDHASATACAASAPGRRR